MRAKRRRQPRSGIAERSLGRSLRLPNQSITDRDVASAPVVDRQVPTCLSCGPSVADLFKALADPTRRAILDELTERGGQTLFELCARLTMKHGLGSTRQAISQHLDVLESAGLVRTRREGRYKFHDVDTAPLKAIAQRWPTEP